MGGKMRTCIIGVAVLSIGTAHGAYKSKPKLDLNRLRDIHNALDVPLVLHGGSGIPDAEVKAAIAAGIRKMNIGTDVCCAFADGTKAALDDPKRSIGIDVFMKRAIASVKALAAEKIKLVGADGKA